MLIDSATAVKNFLINNIDGFDETNVGVEDTRVFDNILGQDNQLKCAIVGLHSLDPTDQTPEFSGFLFKWTLVLNTFFTLWGTEADRHDTIISGYTYLDELISKIKADNRLGGAVMDAYVTKVHAPLTYNRSEMQEYFMLTVEITIVENI